MDTIWDLSVNLRDVVLDFTWLSLLLLVATALRRYVPFLQKFLVPNNVTAGFIGLIIGSQVLGITELAGERLIKYVYHLMALVFIAVGLRQEKSEWGRGAITNGLAFLSNYLIQGSIGLLVALAFIYTTNPDLFGAMGLLVPLGFGMGPGIAASIGGGWERFGFTGGASIGLTFSAIGFLFAFFVGIPLIRKGIKDGETKLIKDLDSISDDVLKGVYPDRSSQKSAGSLPIASEAMESMTFQVGLIGFLYLLTWWFTNAFAGLFISAGLHDLGNIIWSFHFIWANLIAIFSRRLMDRLGMSFMIDRGLMTRSAGLMMDYLIVGAIAAINLMVLWEFWVPILTMSILAGAATYYWNRWLMYRAFRDHHFERFVGIFGEMTGTLQSGLVLVRITDPEFDTPVAIDLVYGSGIALMFGFPLLVILNLPLTVWNNTVAGYWYTLGLMALYFIFVIAVMLGMKLLRLKPVKPEQGS